MKVLLLSDSHSVHTFKWANILSSKGIKVFVWGLSHFNKADYDPGIEVVADGTKEIKYDNTEKALHKIIYLKALKGLKNYIREIKPDIVHAHYATSYGLLGGLTLFKPFVISVWGTDVFNFPRYSFLHKMIFKFNISRANIILSTSEIMKKEIRKYTSKRTEVTPFGVDIEQFKPGKREHGTIVIGTIKALQKRYGTDYLIKAFVIIKNKYPGIPLKLLIVGDGPERKNLQNLAAELKVENEIEFAGHISPNKIAVYHRRINIPVFLSIEESFGVSAVEASACANPVVATNINGYAEVIENNVTGILVKPYDEYSAADAIEKLLLQEELRNQMGKNGRERVCRLYNLDNNADTMISIYKELVQ